MSEKRFGRAMRSLGWIYFNKNEYEKAIECFRKATSVNYYNPNTWFTMGTCYIRLNQFEKAILPFAESVRIDETQG
jgi:tetratricopeptide (TPR) repeat protein